MTTVDDKFEKNIIQTEAKSADSLSCYRSTVIPLIFIMFTSTRNQSINQQVSLPFRCQKTVSGSLSDRNN